MRSERSMPVHYSISISVSARVPAPHWRYRSCEPAAAVMRDMATFAEAGCVAERMREQLRAFAAGVQFLTRIPVPASLGPRTGRSG